MGKKVPSPRRKGASMRYILPGLTLLALSAIPQVVFAQSDIIEFRQREQILIQKMTQRVADTIAQSRKQEKTEPIQAKFALKDLLGQVRDSSELPSELRDRLARQLQTRLNEVEEGI